MSPPPRCYPTDLTDADWQLLAPFIPAPKPGGRPAIHDRRELVNAIASWLRADWPGGCCRPMACRPGRPVSHYFRCWQRQGLSEQVRHQR